MVKASLILCACLVAVFLEVSASPVPDGQGIYGDKFQSDIKYTEEQKRLLFGGEKAENQTGLIDTYWRWPMNLNRQVIVPYRIESRHGYTTAQMNFLLDGMRRIEATTCIRFVVRTNQFDFIDIVNGNGCWSYLGRTGDRQELSMSRNAAHCFMLGTAEHEYMHALGFVHMHSASNRDNFVTINWQNIWPPAVPEFQLLTTGFSQFNTGYDLRSVMHYTRTEFSHNGYDTISPRDPSFNNIIGMGRLSTGDSLRLNRMYQC